MRTRNEINSGNTKNWDEYKKRIHLRINAHKFGPGPTAEETANAVDRFLKKGGKISPMGHILNNK